MDVPETRYVTVDGAEVAYQVLGEGPLDLVFHHGMCHVDLQWDVAPEAAFLRALASFSRLILFDRRGTGASDRGSSDLLPTWEQWSEDLGAVLDAVGAERPAIFGEVEGGATAILFAATHPDRVSALVLGNASARMSVADDYQIGVPREFVDLMTLQYETSWGKPDHVPLAFPSFRDDEDATRSLSKLARAAATPRSAARQLRHVLVDMDVRQALSSIRVPTLIIQSRSPWPPTDHAQYLAEKIEGARLVEVPIEDYLYFAGEFEPVIAEVSEFLIGARPTRPADRVLTTLLFTDIAESTEVAARAGDKRWRSLLDAHDSFVRQQLRRFDGREINTTGDGFIAAFDGPGRAILCARAITQGATKLGINVRAGLHTGECEIRGTDLAGLAVHIAARVGARADPGQVLVSRTVADLVAGSGVVFEDRGEHDLKGVPGTWRLYAVER